MVNVLEKEITCFIKGKKTTKKIVVEFVSNQAHKDYMKIESEIVKTQSKWNNIRMLSEEIEILRDHKPENYMADIDSHIAEIKKLMEELELIADTKIIERRFDLILKILGDNGCQDQELMSPEFWNNCVHPSDVNDLLKSMIEKDLVDAKKKAN